MDSIARRPNKSQKKQGDGSTDVGARTGDKGNFAVCNGDPIAWVQRLSVGWS